MFGNFRRCLDFVLRPENDGRPYHYDHDDQGGPNKWGITLAALADWRRRNGRSRPTVSDLAHLSGLERDAIYQTDFWMRVHGDMLPLGVDLMSFDFGVVANPRISCRLLELAAGYLAHEEAVLDYKALVAISQVRPHTMLDRIEVSQLAYYRSCKTAWKYLHGWRRRLADCKTLALQMLAGEA